MSAEDDAMADDQLEALHLLQEAERRYRDAAKVWASKLPDWPATGRCSCGSTEATFHEAGLFEEEYTVTIEIFENEDVRQDFAEEQWPRDWWAQLVADGSTDSSYAQYVADQIEDHPELMNGVGFEEYDMTVQSARHDEPDGELTYLTCAVCGRAYQPPEHLDWQS